MRRLLGWVFAVSAGALFGYVNYPIPEVKTDLEAWLEQSLGIGEIGSVLVVFGIGILLCLIAWLLLRDRYSGYYASDHLDREIAVRYLEEQLQDIREKHQIECHLDRCEACRTLVEEIDASLHP